MDGYQHNPGNPALVVCPSCDGKHPHHFLLNAPAPSTKGSGPDPPTTGYEDLWQPWLSYSRIARYFAGTASSQGPGPSAGY